MSVRPLLEILHKPMQTEVLYTREEYLALEEEAVDVKHEFDGSEVYAMAGASLEHNQLASNVNVSLSRRVGERSCRVMQSDLRVRVGHRYVYPDVVALCGAPEVTEENPPSLLNPELVVEVASPSTSEKDRTWKLESYLQIESLQEYWIVEVDAPRLQQYVRTGETWTLRTLSGLEASLQSEAFALEVGLDELYRLVLE